MRKRGRQESAALAIAVVGTALVTYGTVVDHLAMYRAGLASLLVGLIALADARNAHAERRLIMHQEAVARLTARERQQYAEMGWKAARLDALEGNTGADENADIVRFPGTRTHSEMRKDGSA
ncbi:MULTISPECIES: hypothetical protein [unclassified Streptomyces]|uniref:hypothetical protein n=1 Tax=unclassified Streptomyces TaxID=2593676 RepID=UPI003425AE05